LNGKLLRVRRLFTTFLRIGAFTFGGGYAMVPLIEREVVEGRKWLKHEEILDIFGVAQSVPGVIAVNVATFTGHRVAGFWGALAAVLGVVLPSFFVICAIAVFFDRFRELAWVGHAFEGARAGVVVIIIGALRKLSHNVPASAFNFGVGCAAFAATAFFNVGAAWVILLAIATGLLASIRENGRREAQRSSSCPFRRDETDRNVRSPLKPRRPRDA